VLLSIIKISTEYFRICSFFRAGYKGEIRGISTKSYGYVAHEFKKNQVGNDICHT